MSTATAHSIDPRIARALSAKRETKVIEFKELFDVSAKRDWCEILKDVIAIANSGGGVLVVGLDSNGTPTGGNIAPVAELDPAVIADKIFSYTGTHYADFEVVRARKSGHDVVAFAIGAAMSPIVFSRPGDYPLPNGKFGSAFARGTVYIRHGAKSEPATSDDLRTMFDRMLRAVRKDWMRGVRKVVQAPTGSVVKVLPPTVRESDEPDATPIRIVNDPNVQAFRVVDYDKSHPYRQKELVAAVKKKLPSGTKFNQYDIQCIRQVHDIASRSDFFHKPRFATPQYSQQFVEWIVEQFGRDSKFFGKARRKSQEQ